MGTRESRRKAGVAAGILLMAAGIAGAGLTYRSMRTENLTHARTGEVAVPFGPDRAEASARFAPWRGGVYRAFLVAESPAGGACDPASALPELAALDGIIDLTVTDPDGRVLLSSSVGPAGTFTPRPAANGWIPVDSLVIPEPDGRPWRLEVAWCPGDPFAPVCSWRVVLLPPQTFEIGGFLSNRVILLLASAGVMVSGFILIVAFGRRRE